MKLIIAGSRTLNIPKEMIAWCVRNKVKGKPTEIVSGCADGIDYSGELYCKYDTKLILKLFPANWTELGKAAGPIRNKQMAEYADALLLIWDGKSKGSFNMKTNMMKLNKPIFEVIIK